MKHTHDYVLLRAEERTDWVTERDLGTLKVYRTRGPTRVIIELKCVDCGKAKTIKFRYDRRRPNEPTSH